jgi:hypothetical protein
MTVMTGFRVREKIPTHQTTPTAEALAKALREAPPA